MTTKTASKKTVKKAKKDSTLNGMAGMTLLGEIITWKAQATNQPALKAALSASGFEEKLAREFLPRHAFARACKRMGDDRIIAVVNEDKDEIKFQFTKGKIEEVGGEQEWVYGKEAYVTLDKTTGKITCKVLALQELAQAELDKAMEVRTTADVTRIVQKLFDENADLVPLRDQGGVYFVPVEHEPFLVRVGTLLEAVGGVLSRFPVPAGTQTGDKAVQEAMADYLADILKQHTLSVDSFTAHTRPDTMEQAAKRVQETRVKIEAYASYLKDRAESLLEEVENAKVHLAERIQKVSEDKKNLPPEESGCKGRVYGAWAADKNATPEHLYELVKGGVKLSTIKGWIGQWARGNNLPAVAKTK